MVFTTPWFRWPTESQNEILRQHAGQCNDFPRTLKLSPDHPKGLLKKDLALHKKNPPTTMIVFDRSLGRLRPAAIGSTEGGANTLQDTQQTTASRSVKLALQTL
jgi:hypothetical protein